jgi:hypothetical protein
MMEVLTPSARKTSTCPTLPSPSTGVGFNQRRRHVFACAALSDVAERSQREHDVSREGVGQVRGKQRVPLHDSPCSALDVHARMVTDSCQALIDGRETPKDDGDPVARLRRDGPGAGLAIR